VLAERKLEAPADAAGREAAHRFAVSDDPERFAKVGARFLGERVTGAEVVTLESA
jgi:hypothetical protein